MYIEKEIELLKKQIQDLVKRVELLEDEEKIKKQINEYEDYEENKRLFEEYLIKEKGLKKGTSDTYFRSLNLIRKRFKKYLNIDLEKNIYEITDLSELYDIKDKFENSGDFIHLNLVYHHALSAALNNYIAFIDHNHCTLVLDE